MPLLRSLVIQKPGLALGIPFSYSEQKLWMAFRSEILWQIYFGSKIGLKINLNWIKIEFWGSVQGSRVSDFGLVITEHSSLTFETVDLYWLFREKPPDLTFYLQRQQ